MIRCRLFAVSMVMAGVALGVLRLQAMTTLVITDNVPIDRVVQNLERRAREQPKDIETRLNLARVHAMAYSSKTETVVVFGSGPGAPKSNEPYFTDWPLSLFRSPVTPARNASAAKVAKEHLAKAIENYNAAIAIDPSHLIARLGRAWCLQQSGDRRGAMAGYRELLKDAWVSESAANQGFQDSFPLTVEASGYLFPLLDPRRDAAEIADIQSKFRTIQLSARPRPISPIVIPLQANLQLSDLVDRSASVVFDADGSVPKPWSWISPNAGWLVFDQHGRGHIDSALSLFGNVTFWLFWDNGYHAMKALDDNGDGELAGRELAGLAIWHDGNGNGISDSGEVRTVAEWHIRSLSCRFQTMANDTSAEVWSPYGVTFEDGATRPTFDVLLHPAKSHSS